MATVNRNFWRLRRFGCWVCQACVNGVFTRTAQHSCMVRAVAMRTGQCLPVTLHGRHRRCLLSATMEPFCSTSRGRRSSTAGQLLCLRWSNLCECAWCTHQRRTLRRQHVCQAVAEALRTVACSESATFATLLTRLMAASPWQCRCTGGPTAGVHSCRAVMWSCCGHYRTYTVLN